jgi:hypothetical protein
MKKIVSTFALALLVGGLTFAQDASVKVGAWGRALFVPVITGGTNLDGDAVTQSALGVSWGGVPRVGITVSGTSEFVGFQLDINGDGNAVTAGDQQKIWVKPLTGLTVTAGRAYDDTLRGNSAFGSFDWVRLSSIQGEDNVFSRVRTEGAGGTNGGFIVSYAVDALYAVVSFNNLNNAAEDMSEETLKNLQYGAGYTIKDVGLIRAQVIGLGSAADANLYEAAFRLTAVQNLYLDVGIKYPTDTEAFQNYSFDLEAYANYTVDAAKVHLLVSYKPTADEDLAKTAMGVSAGLDYSLGDGLGFSGDLRYYSKEGAYGVLGDELDSNITFFAGITKGFSNGLVGVGVQYATAQSGGTFGANNNPDNAGQLLLPVRLEYWF